LVVKYSDNLYKGFCASIAIVIAGGLDSLMFQYTMINSTFLLGSSLVLLSTILFYFISGAHSSLVGSVTVSVPTLPTTVTATHDQ
jgi:hypothetical protein